MRVQSIVRRGAFALALIAMNCGGSSYSPGPSPSPNPAPSPSPPANQAGQVSIVGDRGNQSFTPNPSSPASGMVTWNNDDTVVHRIVANDNSFDTGNIQPGESSAAIAVAAAGTNFHCSIHPSMVGAVANSAGTAPPCTGLYC